jgi:hypothetical protein
MKHSTKLALAVWVFLALVVILEEVFHFDWMTSSAYSYGTILIGAVLVFTWFLADTREHGIDASPILKVMVVAIALVAVPYYRFRYMGAKRGFIFVGKVLGGFVALVVFATAAILIGETLPAV